MLAHMTRVKVSEQERVFPSRVLEISYRLSHDRNQ